MMRFLAIGCLALTSALAAELPVRTVVLYKHGVGYFQRAGELGPGESARLDFKASEMNDVLKSLTIGSTGGQGIAALRYDASEPTSKKLENYPFRVDERQPLAVFLDQLKGEQVTLAFGSETVTGTIVSARVTPATEQRPEVQQITLLLPSGEIVNRDLSAASSVRFPDQALQLKLRDYLGVLSDARSQERRSVYIDSSDSGTRQIRASYMIPTAVWKSSYRLILSESGDPTLEGWAIVDNTTGDDWTNVQMALVSGRPISFISRLYEPKYVDRPEVELAEDQPVRPQLHKGAMAMAEAAPPPAPARAMERGDFAGAAGGVIGGIVGRDELRSSDVANTAQGRELGDLFEYRFDGTITIRQDESAMLPFLQQEIGARKLLIYSDHSSRHPMNAAELTNSTGKTLDGGPITVFEAGAYGGEALMETLKAGEERLISYGVDLGTRITTRFDSNQMKVREVHFRRGMLTTRSALRETRTYTIRNVDDKAKTLVIEHPARPGYELLDQKPDEKTENAYRFEVPLDPQSTETFAVNEERLLSNSFAVTNITPDVLLTYVENRDLSSEARDALGKILDLKRQIAQADADIAANEQRVREVTADQDRIRQNIGSLNRVAGQQERVTEYATQLADSEAQLAQLRDEAQQLRRQRQQLQQQLNDLIEQTEF